MSLPIICLFKPQVYIEVQDQPQVYVKRQDRSLFSITFVAPWGFYDTVNLTDLPQFFCKFTWLTWKLM